MEFYDLGDYIRAFDNTPEGRKTKIYELCNLKNELIKLGQIRWNGSWRKYCFYPIDETVFDNKCLIEIIFFLEHLTKKRKEEN